MSNNSSWQSKPPTTATTNAFAGIGLKPSPLSSRTASPAATTASQNKKPTADSFSNLVSFGRDKQQSNLSLLEQQQQIEAKRRHDAEENRRKMDALFGGESSSGGAFWDQLGAGKTTNTAAPVDDDDILAAFNSTAPVENRSHFPPPSHSASQTPEAGAGFELLGGDLLGTSSPHAHAVDPFDPVNLPSRDFSPFNSKPAANAADDDFDILGDLSKPVSELPPRPAPQQAPPASDPKDHAIAEIMDMGFSAEQAQQALGETDSGVDVQAAISWLLDQAHSKSKPATLAPTRGESSRGEPSVRRQRTPEYEEEDESWTRPTRPPARSNGSNDSRARGGAPRTNGEKDLGALTVSSSRRNSSCMRSSSVKMSEGSKGSELMVGCMRGGCKG